MADQSVVASPSTQASPGSLTRLGGFAGLAEQPAVRRALPAIGVVGTAGMAALAWWALQTPAQTPLFAGLAESDKAAVAQALQTSGIAYSFESGSGTLQVDEDKLHEARMLLAGQGLPKAAPAGDAMIAALPMGSSRAVEGETLRGAREADLARTIEAIDAVKSARVHLATPEPSVFVRDAQAPAASVMLTIQPGRSLTPAQVRAIGHLVASAVPGLTPAGVSVIDQTGALLSGPDAEADNRGFALQQQTETRLRQAVIALLAPVVGRENVSVEVHADIDASESQATRETYPKEDRALRREEGNKSASTGPAVPAAVGIPGATSNQPPLPAQIAQTPPGTAAAGAATPPSQSNETYTRNFDVGREISVTHRPQGKLTRVTVAVALRDPKGAKKRTAADVAAIEALVKGAVGFDGARGDIVAISSRPFVDVPVTTVAWYDAPWLMPLLRQVGGVLAALLVLLLFGRPLIKALRSRAATPPARSTDELERQLLDAPRRIGRTGPGNANREITLDMIEAAPSYEARAALVRTFVAQDPERAALTVQALMREQARG